MIPRLLKLPKNDNVLLFGPRNCGKTTLIHQTYNEKSSLFIDLLRPDVEERFANNPAEIINIVEALPKNITHVIIDEIQKNPKLLDSVHYLIENTKKIFVLTGSSAKKLRASGVNLLAGRALVYNLFPFSYFEIENNFDLKKALEWGMLPKIQYSKTKKLKMKFLQSYSQTYLKEEIWNEHIIRKLNPFRKFLEVAAQMNGKIINYSKIAADVGVDDKTVKNYYSVLEDTLVGFHLETFHNSFRKRLNNKPKFYFCDTGIARSLAKTLSTETESSTSYYGLLFEQFIITEIIKLSSYFDQEYSFSYLKTKDDAEIDLVVERPGKPILFIEIKSTNNVTESMLSSFSNLIKDFGPCEAVCFSCDPKKKKIKNMTIFPWQEGLKYYFYK